MKGKKVAIISSDNPYSKGISEGMKPLFKAAGWTITVDEIVPFGEVSDWRAVLAKVRQDPPDLVINTDYLPGNSALFLKQFLEQPTASLVFLQYAPSVPEFIKLTGAQSTGVLYDLIGAPMDSPKWPRGQMLLKAYKDKYGVEFGPLRGGPLRNDPDLFQGPRRGRRSAQSQGDRPGAGQAEGGVGCRRHRVQPEELMWRCRTPTTSR